MYALIQCLMLAYPINETSSISVKAVDKKLADLYSRRLAVNSLIRSLEGYAAFQAKNGHRRRLKSA